LNNTLTLTDDEIEGILERNVTEESLSAKKMSKKIYLKEGLSHNHKIKGGSKGQVIVSYTP